MFDHPVHSIGNLLRLCQTSILGKFGMKGRKFILMAKVNPIKRNVFYVMSEGNGMMVVWWENRWLLLLPTKLYLDPSEKRAKIKQRKSSSFLSKLSKLIFKCSNLNFRAYLTLSMRSFWHKIQNEEWITDYFIITHNDFWRENCYKRVK